MLLAIFLFILILGFVLFVVAILFYKQRTGKREYSLQEPPPARNREQEQMNQNEAPAGLRGGRSIRDEPAVLEDTEEGWAASSSADAGAYIPVLRSVKNIPGVKDFELVHFVGRGGLFSIVSLQNPGKITIRENELIREIEGTIVLTSHKLLIHDAKSMRKIVFGAIGGYQFQEPFLVIMRKDVKKKKEVVRVYERIPEFRYIFGVLAGTAAARDGRRI
jgi:hypothetical protein